MNYLNVNHVKWV